MDIITTKEQFDEVLQNNTAVFVDFYADWCGPCKMVGPIVEKLAGANPEVTFIKVNVDMASEVAEKYQIMSIPALLTFKNGEVVNQVVGVHLEAELQAMVDELK